MINILYVSDRVDAISINHIYRMKDNDTKIQLPTLPMYVIVNFDDKMNCEDLAEIRYAATYRCINNISDWISSDKSTMAGIGLYEELIHCSNRRGASDTYFADFVVLNHKFGNTVGVTESFGLFQQRMNSLQHELIQFLNYLGDNENVNQIIYYPNRNSVGTESHRRLLMGYAKTWTNTSAIIEKRLTIQAPFFEQEDIKEFSVIPDVENRNKCMETYKPEVGELFWHFPSALSEISKYFNSVILKHGE